MSQFFFPAPNQPETNFKNYSILLGALSSGNLPQGTIQTILTALPDTVPFGVYHDPASVEPFVTSISTHKNTTTTMSDDPIPQPNSIAFAIELYINHTIKTIFVVQRARIMENRSNTFIKTFCSFLESLSPSYMTLLTSLGPSHRPAENKDLIQFFTVEVDQVDGESKTKPNPQPYQSPYSTTLQSAPFSLPPTHMSPDELDAHAQYLKIRYGENNKTPLHFPIPIKGGGLTRQYAKFARKSSIPLIGFVTFPGPGAIVTLVEQVLAFISANLKSQHNLDWSLSSSIVLTAPDLEDYC